MQINGDVCSIGRNKQHSNKQNKHDWWPMFELSLVRLDALLLSVQNCQHCTWEKKKSKEYIRYYDCGGRRNVRPAVNLDFDTFGLFPKEEEWRWAQWKWQANGRHRERPQEHTWSRVIFVRREPAYAINRPDFGGHKIQFFPFFFSLSLNCFPIGRKLSTE